MSTKCTTPDCTEFAAYEVRIGDREFPACTACSDFMKEHTDCPATGTSDEEIDF